MHDAPAAYGQRSLVVINSLVFVMFPMLVFMYGRLARSEERGMLARFGDEYARYAARTPRFIPRLTRRTARNETHTEIQGGCETSASRSDTPCGSPAMTRGAATVPGAW